MELDLTQVRAFVVTAEQLHFGRAAARLFLTQQALSKRIQRLEHSLGEPLFVRGTRGVELTEAGHRFLPHARALLAPADLRESGLWLPASGSPAELLSAYRQIAGHFGIPLDTSGHNLGLEHAIDQLRRHPHRLILFGADWPLPPDAGVRRLPLHPKPCFLWSLVWPERHHHPQLELLLERAVHAGRSEGWLAYDPRQDWLPDTDLAELRGPPADEPKRRGLPAGLDGDRRSRGWVLPPVWLAGDRAPSARGAGLQVPRPVPGMVRLRSGPERLFSVIPAPRGASARCRSRAAARR